MSQWHGTIFGILRLPSDDYVFPKKAVIGVIEQMQKQLFDWEKNGKIKLAPGLHQTAEEVMIEGVNTLGIYHTEKPLKFSKDSDVLSSNFRVLYFYHNRLESYHLDKFVQWKAEGIEVLKLD